MVHLETRAGEGSSDGFGESLWEGKYRKRHIATCQQMRLRDADIREAANTTMKVATNKENLSETNKSDQSILIQAPRLRDFPYLF